MGFFALIGSGSFNLTLLRTLAAEGQKVLVVDRDRDAIQRAKDYAFKAVLADAGDLEALRHLGLESVDSAVVSLGGDRIDASVLATLHLRELGVKAIIAKAISDDHERVLRAIGADRIIFPERDLAVSLGQELSHSGFHKVVHVEQGLELVEMVAPKSFVGRALRDIDMREAHRAQVLFIKRRVAEQAEHTGQTIFPRASEQVLEGDLLMLAVETDALDALRKLK